MDNNRRDFLKIMAAGAAAAALPAYAQQPKKEKAGKLPAQTVLPRWRGFNLQYLFTKGRYSGPVEDDFRWTRDWGFDFIRLPITVEDYERVVRATVKTIRDINPKRLIIIDGLKVGTEPIPELADLGIGQSCRGYMPGGISHYRAGWVDKNGTFPEPLWPGRRWDRKRLEQHYQKWADLAKKSVGVHCGECGCYNKTPYDVFFAWFKDVLEILTNHNIGFALWNLRGAFGVVDSGREDAQYDDFHGHKLDRKLLNLMQKCE